MEKRFLTKFGPHTAAVVVGRAMTPAGCLCSVRSPTGEHLLSRRLFDMTPGRIVGIGKRTLAALQHAPTEGLAKLSSFTPRSDEAEGLCVVARGWAVSRSVCPHVVSDCSECPWMRLPAQRSVEVKASRGRHHIQRAFLSEAARLEHQLLEPITAGSAAANSRREMQWHFRCAADTDAPDVVLGMVVQADGGAHRIPKCFVGTLTMKRVAAALERWATSEVVSRELRAALRLVTVAECATTRSFRIVLEAELPPYSSTEDAELLWFNGASSSAGTLSPAEVALCDHVTAAATVPAIENVQVCTRVTSPKTPVVVDRELITRRAGVVPDVAFQTEVLHVSTGDFNRDVVVPLRTNGEETESASSDLSAYKRPREVLLSLIAVMCLSHPVASVRCAAGVPSWMAEALTAVLSASQQHNICAAKGDGQYDVVVVAALRCGDCSAQGLHECISSASSAMAQRIFVVLDGFDDLTDGQQDIFRTVASFCAAPGSPKSSWSSESVVIDCDSFSSRMVTLLHISRDAA